MQFEVKILDIIEKLFIGTNICIDRLKTNEKFLVLVDIVTNIEINLNWEDSYIFLENSDYNFQDLYANNNDSYVLGIFKEISRKQLYILSNENNFTLWAGNINHFTGRVTQGFSKQTEKFAEFIIEINDKYLNDFHEMSKYMIYIFRIGNVDLEISNPSDFFKLIFMQNSFLGIRGGWNHVITLKMKNVIKTEMESILQQALFLFNLKISGMFIFGLNINSTNQPNFDYIERNIKKVSFPRAKYFEAIAYYNVAIYSPEEMCFHYYYKVIEYFFKKRV